MNYIWYNPNNKTYQVGNEMEYNIQRAKSNSSEDIVILYELDEVTNRLAEKIVNELNTVSNEINV
ncbi:MAG: hypothetical protein RIA69_01445 [Cyclobacteriaceae bacterium]